MKEPAKNTSPEAVRLREAAQDFAKPRPESSDHEDKAGMRRNRELLEAAIAYAAVVAAAADKSERDPSLPVFLHSFCGRRPLLQIEARHVGDGPWQVKFVHAALLEKTGQEPVGTGHSESSARDDFARRVNKKTVVFHKGGDPESVEVPELIW